MGTKAELIFPVGLKNDAIICHLCKAFDIVLNIVEASFSTDIGWAILVFEGRQEEVEKAFKYLRDKGVEIKDIQRTS